MRNLYFDCASGISGNMVLGALLEIAGDVEGFLAELKKLHIDGYKIEISKKKSYGICGTYVNVIVDGTDEMGHKHHIGGDYAHEHQDMQEQKHHVHRNLADVYHIIEDSALAEDVKSLAKEIFYKVAVAESKVHGEPLEKVHFHEVGAMDSIIDIVGTAILICQIQPEHVYASVVNEGRGFIDCAHGRMAVPVPATSEIFAEGRVHFQQIDVETELVTPTGAAILATLVEAYGPMQAMELKQVGYGLGSREIGYANALKVYVGDALQKGQIWIMETNIDDITGEELGYTMERLFAAGARDVYYTPVYMKKNRPAYKLTVVYEKELQNTLEEIVFRETSTIGVRYYPVERTMLKRVIKTEETAFGPVRFKEVETPGGKRYQYPEYEDLRGIAKETGRSIKELKGLLHR